MKLNRSIVLLVFNNDCQVVVAEWAGVAGNPRTEQVNQTNVRKLSKNRWKMTQQERGGHEVIVARRSTGQYFLLVETNLVT